MDRMGEREEAAVVGDARRAQRTPRLARVKTWLVGAAALALIAWAGTWVYHRWTHVYIDDARIDGEVVTIASRVSGWVTELPVIEGDPVKAGQVIARVDERDSLLQREVLQARLNTIEREMGVIRAQSGQVDQETRGRTQAEANRIAAAQAEVAVMENALAQARHDYERAVDLHERKFFSRQAMEHARTAYRKAQESHRKAQAEVAAARGNLSSARGSRRQLQVMERQLAVLESQAGEIRAEIARREIDIADRTIRSPADGRIVMTFVRAGEHVAAGQRIAMFHDPDRIWVEANVKETAIGQLRAGMPVYVHVDAYPDRVFKGRIQRVGQAATSTFALLPDPNPSGNFTKITQRLPVRIALEDNDAALRPGMMVEVDVPLGND